jgi:hypothetical protein
MVEIFSPKQWQKIGKQWQKWQKWQNGEKWQIGKNGKLAKMAKNCKTFGLLHKLLLVFGKFS